MASNTIRTITILDSNGGSIQKEGIALAGTIYPGMLIERAAGGVQVQATTSIAVQMAIAIENALQNAPNGSSIDTVYAIGDQVPYKIFQRGAEFNGLVAASAAAIAYGAFVESAGGGTFKVYSAGVKLGIALEAVDNSANSASTARIRIEAL